jgi:hypothetical protein
VSITLTAVSRGILVESLSPTDAELIKAIEAVPDLKTYLAARFSLRDDDMRWFSRLVSARCEAQLVTLPGLPECAPAFCI